MYLHMCPEPDMQIISDTNPQLCYLLCNIYYEYFKNVLLRNTDTWSLAFTFVNFEHCACEDFY
jgi:hypothetical protein